MTNVSSQYLLNFAIDVFVPFARQQLGTRGQLKQRDSAFSFDGEFLLGFENQLVKVDTLGGVNGIRENYFAIGSGVEFALGSLMTSKYTKMSPPVRLKVALTACSQYCAWILPPYVYSKTY